MLPQPKHQYKTSFIDLGLKVGWELVSSSVFCEGVEWLPELCSSVGAFGVAVLGGGSGARLHEVSVDDSALLYGDD